LQFWTTTTITTTSYPAPDPTPPYFQFPQTNPSDSDYSKIVPKLNQTTTTLLAAITTIKTQKSTKKPTKLHYSPPSIT
jgi:hypothetical protein